MGCCYRMSRGGVRRFDLDRLYAVRWDGGCCGPGIFMMERSRLKGKKNQTNIHLQLIGIVYVTNEYNNNISIKIFLDYIYIYSSGWAGIFVWYIHDHGSCDHPLNHFRTSTVVRVILLLVIRVLFKFYLYLSLGSGRNKTLGAISEISKPSQFYQDPFGQFLSRKRTWVPT